MRNDIIEKTITLLGSTGSIGTQALDVARAHGIKIKALAAGKNAELLEAQAREFKPSTVALSDERLAKQLKVSLADTDIKVTGGDSAAEELAAESCDAVLNAIVGIAGLKSTLAAIGSGNTLALANKESLVCAGDIVMESARKNNVSILPVDSEHSAIFQCLQGIPEGAVSKILLTASGGPFFGKTKKELENATVADALNHPNWDMGAKITVDSATMMNKGLEVIEAMHLFGVSAKDIEILVHRQSIVHSAVETADGAVIAQLGTPDMRLPIQYALTYPKRLSCPCKRLSLTQIGSLTFEKPDTDTFLCLAACLKAAESRGLKTAAANGAGEAAVKLFLDGKLKFLQIGELVSSAVDNQAAVKSYNIDDVFAADKAARAFVLDSVL